MQNDNADNSS